MPDWKVLVVEDDPILRRFISDALRRKGCEVTSVEDGTFAVEEIKKKSFHLVVSDLKMHRMHGMELLTEVKKIAPQTDVVIITAFGTVTSAVEAMKRGAFDYVTKPVELDELDITIERAFEHQKLVNENQYLKQELVKNAASSHIVGVSSESQRIRELVEMVGPLDSTVLITGETGVGKEVVANAIFQASLRRDKPFVKVNCAALPESLLESELFGHEKGAFTGAIQRTKGRFELADGGALLLDEIGELGMQVQAKLLRVIQYQQFERIGGEKSVAVDVRVIATTNRNLKEEVRKGTFRKDLFFRLNVVPVSISPLRERKEDVPFFIETFLNRFNNKYRKAKNLSPKATELLMRWDWPGNVRELENCIETAIILSKDEQLGPEHFAFLEEHRDLMDDSSPFHDGMTIAEAEKKLILRVYERQHQNKTHTAKALGITIKTLRAKLREYGVIEESG